MAELIVQEQGNADLPLTNSEQRVAGLIMQHSQNEYDSVIRDAVWDIFYQMSPLREGLFNWYPFRENCQILQLSNGFGGVTGILARVSKKITVLEPSLLRAECIAKRCEAYNNVSIRVGSIQETLFEEKFDYIICEETVNTRHDMQMLFEQIIPFLKEDGRILFVCENRFGMKYWCGVPDPVSNIPFGGIRRNIGNRMMTRQDLIEALKQNEEVKGWNIYYPFPDYRLPQVVYSDDYLPQTSVRDRVIPYYPAEQQDSLVCLEKEISDELIANQVFHIFSNSFLIECGKQQFKPDAIFAAISTDRGREHGFATVISGHGTVQKRNLYPEGKKSLNLIYQNQLELEAHGIKCVRQLLSENMIEMPFVKGKTLIEYLKYLYLNAKEKVDEIFDCLYWNIVKSSEHISFADCKIKDKCLNEQNAGVILKKAYIDMIPYNSFYEDGEIVFYDQEFVKEGIPAKYVLFRALRYTYIYITEAKSIVPLQYYKKKYELEEIWDLFEREEARFVEDNRNYDLLTSFYKWSGISSEEVDRNIEKLQCEKKTVRIPLKKHRYDLSKYENDLEMLAVKRVQIQMLQRFIDVCAENDLSYCAFYGTLLGVVRHKGYVPWDDDMDLLMPRKDYDHFIALAPDAFKEPYFLQTPENDEDCFYGGYMKLRRSDTTGIEERNSGKNCNQGIWIDIFPLDEVLKDEELKREQMEKVQFFQRLLLKKTYPEKRMIFDLSKEEEQDYCRMSRYFSRESLCRGLHETIVKYEGEKSDKVAVIARYWNGKAYKEYEKSDFSYLIKRQFENLSIYIPNGYEHCLAKDYGKNFSLYPEEEDRKMHHKVLFDAGKSYVDYIKETSYNEQIEEFE